MEITAIIRDSLIDYPGKNSLVVFSRGCNFKCPYCYANEVFNRKKCINAFEYIGDWTDGLVLLGGEPTIYPSIFEFAKKIKDYRLSIKLDTNGSNPEILKKLIDESLIDYVAMDIKACPELYEKVTGVKVDLKKLEESMKILSNSKIKYEFRTTIIPLFIDENYRWLNKNEVKKIAEWIIKSTDNSNHLYYLQKFISRKKSEMIDSKYSLDEIPNEFSETTIEILQELKNEIKPILKNVKIRGE